MEKVRKNPNNKKLPKSTYHAIKIEGKSSKDRTDNWASTISDRMQNPFPVVFMDLLIFIQLY